MARSYTRLEVFRWSGKMIWEDTVLVYSYIRASAFLEHLERLHTFLHRLGREANQGEVVVEFGDSMYHISRSLIPNEANGPVQKLTAPRAS